MDRKPGIAVLGAVRLAGVHPHADVKLNAPGPGVLCEISLRRSRTVDGITRAMEGNEERVDLRINLYTTTLGERHAQQSSMGCQRVDVGLLELLHQVRRLRDVSEYE